MLGYVHIIFDHAA